MEQGSARANLKRLTRLAVLLAQPQIEVQGPRTAYTRRCPRTRRGTRTRSKRLAIGLCWLENCRIEDRPANPCAPPEHTRPPRRTTAQGAQRTFLPPLPAALPRDRTAGMRIKRTASVPSGTLPRTRRLSNQISRFPGRNLVDNAQPMLQVHVGHSIDAGRSQK